MSEAGRLTNREMEVREETRKRGKRNNKSKRASCASQTLLRGAHVT